MSQLDESRADTAAPINSGAYAPHTLKSIGVGGGVDGPSISLHMEIPPGGTEPDRLAIEIRIPLSTLRQLSESADPG